MSDEVLFPAGRSELRLLNAAEMGVLMIDLRRHALEDASADLRRDYSAAGLSIEDMAVLAVFNVLLPSEVGLDALEARQTEALLMHYIQHYAKVRFEAVWP